ncbi:inositol monophosphatase family protein [Halobacteriovorax sp. XZX-3]|uniref:inositol monophosphatase family protein n=1 Tax=unclassified Halobacteriovorax TaxID=2639665 RepID=UPI000CD0EE11|nr:inositol monophosphatase family protein [Halobacteriovorax sp. DA5]POB13807.1 hypothetical protein C0Z22_07045 [Halobacteriovorax sp. DA5]
MYRNELEEIKSSIHTKLDTMVWGDMSIERKADKSIVTEFDIFVSDQVKKVFHESNFDFNFFSEEDQESFEFPVIVLDPIDGTREFAKGYGECAVSLAILYSADIHDDRNFGWIYNPFTGFEITSDVKYPLGSRHAHAEAVNIMISRSEWEKGANKLDFKHNFRITPLGSIAFKLGLLAAGAAECVISFRDKNIWDIAAGVIICHSRGIYSDEIDDLSTKKLKGPFIFCRDELKEAVHKEVNRLKNS